MRKIIFDKKYISLIWQCSVTGSILIQQGVRELQSQWVVQQRTRLFSPSDLCLPSVLSVLIPLAHFNRVSLYNLFIQIHFEMFLIIVTVPASSTSSVSLQIPITHRVKYSACRSPSNLLPLTFKSLLSRFRYPCPQKSSSGSQHNLCLS